MGTVISGLINFLKSFGKKDAIWLLVVAVFVFTVVSLEVLSRATVEVTIDEKGFHPNLITIQPGQMVTWRNTGNKGRWPASNSHPTHTNYPGEEKGCLGSKLDACKAMATGESYSFLFTQTGSWGMHDHITPGNLMVVQVEDVGRGWLGKAHLLIKRLFNKQAVIKEVSPEEFRRMDITEQISALQLYSKNDPKRAWEYLKSAFVVNGQILGNPHELAHTVGAASYAKSGVQGVSICDQTFAYGCFHGVAEAAISEKGASAVVAIEKACTDALNQAQAPSCYHGIGHGAAGISNLEVPPALVVCDKMEQSHREYCYDGVFMEQATALGASAVNKDKPWELCGSLDQKFHMACGRYQPTRMRAAGLDFKQTIISCSPAPSDILEENCFRSSGFAAAGSGTEGVQAVNDLCNSTPSQRGVALCLSSAAVEMTFQAYNGWQTVAPKLCEQIADSTYKNSCLKEYQEIVKREGR